MKRLLIGFALLIVLLLAAIYILIPAKLTISKVIVVNCIPDAANRLVLQPNNWQKWWPANQKNNFSATPSPVGSFVYNDDTFTIKHRYQIALDLQFKSAAESNDSRLTVFPMSSDKVALQWESALQTGMNPFKKVQRYRQAVRIKENMSGILNQLKAFLENKERVYGLGINKTSTKDTLLVATRAVFTEQPTTENIYLLAEKLQRYIQEQGAIQTGSPMLNVTETPGQFQVMVAIPTNKMLTGSGAIFFRKMVPGNFLVAEVYGGNKAVQDALTNFELYATDHKKTLMALPFQTLITDRRKEPDSLKWLTKIYYPVN